MRLALRLLPGVAAAAAAAALMAANGEAKGEAEASPAPPAGSPETGAAGGGEAAPPPCKPLVGGDVERSRELERVVEEGTPADDSPAEPRADGGASCARAGVCGGSGGRPCDARRCTAAAPAGCISITASAAAAGTPDDRRLGGRRLRVASTSAADGRSAGSSAGSGRRGRRRAAGRALGRSRWLRGRHPCSCRRTGPTQASDSASPPTCHAGLLQRRHLWRAQVGPKRRQHAAPRALACGARAQGRQRGGFRATGSSRPASTAASLRGRPLHTRHSGLHTLLCTPHESMQTCLKRSPTG